MEASRSLPARAADVLAHPVPALPVNVGPAERLVSAATGALLVGLGANRGGWPGALLATLGGAVTLRGVTGYCPAFAALGRSSATPNAVTLDAALSISRPRAEVFAAWSNLDTLEQAMKHVESIEGVPGGRTRWTAQGPKGIGKLTWVSEETNRVENSELAWRTVEGDVDHAGRVVFTDTPDGRGTEIRVHWRYLAPVGTGPAAHFVTPALEAMLRTDLRAFRALLEAGEVPTTEGQPRGD